MSPSVDPCGPEQQALADAQAQLARDQAALAQEMLGVGPSYDEPDAMNAALAEFGRDRQIVDSLGPDAHKDRERSLEVAVATDRLLVSVAENTLAACRAKKTAEPEVQIMIGATPPSFAPQQIIIDMPPAPPIEVESVVDDLGPATAAMAADVIGSDLSANPISTRPGKIVVPITEGGHVKIPMLGGAIICGLLTLALIGVAVSGNDTTPTAIAAPTQVPTPTPAVTASVTASRAATLASPAIGSPVFVNFQNPLAEVVISGFGAPPPGTHLDHVSTFRMQATGTGLVYLWTLTNPVCGALSGAQARAASVTWDHSACPTLESAARIGVTVLRATDLGADGTPGAAAAYFTYAQTARAGDSFATDPLPKNDTLQYFGPAAAAPRTAAPVATSVAANTPAPATQSGSRLPWAPLAAAVSAVACGALLWRSGVVRVLRG